MRRRARQLAILVSCLGALAAASVGVVIRTPTAPLQVLFLTVIWIILLYRCSYLQQQVRKWKSVAEEQQFLAESLKGELDLFEDDEW